jgi:hypothetical protein
VAWAIATEWKFVESRSASTVSLAQAAAWDSIPLGAKIRLLLFVVGLRNANAITTIRLRVGIERVGKSGFTRFP